MLRLVVLNIKKDACNCFIYIYQVYLFVSTIITQEPLDRFASNLIEEPRNVEWAQDKA